MIRLPTKYGPMTQAELEAAVREAEEAYDRALEEAHEAEEKLVYLMDMAGIDPGT